ncbi:hypothetical protein Aduo_018588 [Ancylostoma duodenale]
MTEEVSTERSDLVASIPSQVAGGIGPIVGEHRLRKPSAEPPTFRKGPASTTIKVGTSQPTAHFESPSNKMFIAGKPATQIHTRNNRASAEREKDFVDEEIITLLHTGAITEFESKPTVVSPLSVAVGHEAMIHLRAMNDRVIHSLVPLDWRGQKDEDEQHEIDYWIHRLKEDPSPWKMAYICSQTKKEGSGEEVQPMRSLDNGTETAAIQRRGR